MNIFSENYQDTPWVVDLTQRVKFHKNHHIGRLNEANQIPSDVPRVNVSYYPSDAVEKSRSNRPVEHDVRRDSIVSFPPGTISPRGGVWLIPDSFDELPDQIKSHPKVGLVFRKFIENRKLERLLKAKAESEPEAVRNLKLTQSSMFREEAELAMNNKIENIIEEAVKSSSSSDGSS